MTSLPSIPSIAAVSPESPALGSGLPPDYNLFLSSPLRHDLVTRSPPISPPGISSPQDNAQVSHKEIYQESQIVIPRETSTGADSLLSMPEVEFLISRDNNSSSSNSNKNSRHIHDFLLPKTHFYDIEARLPLQKELHLFYTADLRHPSWTLPITDLAHTDRISEYVFSYFKHVHPSAPLVTIAQYIEVSNKMFYAGAGAAVADTDADTHAHTPTAKDRPASATTADSDHSIQKAICLTIWALGAMVTGEQKSHEQDALLYFQPAFKIIQHHALWQFGPSLAVCQAFLLAASYFAHIGRPLYNARMVHLAGRQLLKLHAQKADSSYDTEHQRDFLVAFWVCFLWESDCAAEFNVPLSGIATLSADVPLPTLRESDDLTTMIYLSAEITACKISNRAREWLYGPISSNATPPTLPPISDFDIPDASITTQPYKRRRGDNDNLALEAPRSTPIKPCGFGAATVSKVLGDSTELNQQLDTWYRTIPDNIRPPLQGNVVLSDAGHTGNRDSPPVPKPLSNRAQILRAQYFAIRHIIHRPFILAIAQQQKQSIAARECRKAAAHSAGNADGSNSTNSTDNTKRARGIKRSKPNSDEPRPLPLAILEKCAICVNSCLMFLDNVLPLLHYRSPYLWPFCQNSVACLVILLVVQACPLMNDHSTMRQAFPRGKFRRVNIARLRDQVAEKLSRWAIEGSSLQAKLHLIQSLPVPASDSTLFMIPASVAGSSTGASS